MLIITNGLGQAGDGSSGQLMLTGGLGSPGIPQDLCANVLLLGATSTSSTLQIIFNTSVKLSGPAKETENWSITQTTGVPVTISSLEAVDNTVLLQITEQTAGAIYSLNLPVNGITSPYNQTYAGPYSIEFTGVASASEIITSVALDYNLIQIIFSKPVTISDALVPSNYSIDNGIIVQSVVQVTPQIFNLTTSRLHSSTSYNVTISNIRDFAGNPI